MNFVSERDHIMLINELTYGMDQAGQLKLQLGSSSSSSAYSAVSCQVQKDLLLQRVLSSFEKALLILHWTTTTTTDSAAQSLPLPPPPQVDSSLSMNSISSTISENSMPNSIQQQNIKPESSKKRKKLHTWTEQVIVSAEHGLEGPADDGFSWRKYGQKDILGATYPRSYYRCTYRHIQNCWATKQVQRSDDHPSVFDITYRGLHTCHQATNNSSQKIEQKPTNFLSNHQTPHELLMNFQTTLGGEGGIKTGDSISNNKNADFIFSNSPSACTWFGGENQFENLLGTNHVSFSTPNMFESSNYFTASSCNNNIQTEISFLQQYENELSEIISADASSVTNSTNAAGLQFSADRVDFDHSFLCDITDFLS